MRFGSGPGLVRDQVRSLNDQAQFFNTITIDPVGMKLRHAFSPSVIAQTDHQLEGARPQGGEVDISSRWVGSRSRMGVIETDIKTVTFVADDLNEVPAIYLKAVARGRRGIPGGSEPADPSITHADQATNFVGSAFPCVFDDRVSVGSGNADG